MFRFVALFALVAVAAAEPQWINPYMGVHSAAAHLKTPSGDTVSVQAAKIQHHQLKANEYAKKAYVPYYHSNVVAAPVSSVYNMPATYAAATVPYTHGVYSAHHLIGKREAEADSQYYTSAYAGVSPYYNMYNHGVYGAYSGLTGYSMPYGTYGMHHLGKREAEADSQFYTSAYAGVTPYYNNVYNHGVYGAYSGLTGYTMPYSTYGMGIRHLGKREAEADSQFYSNVYSGYPTYNNVYNTAGVYGRYSGYPYTTTYGNVWNRFLY